MYWIIFIGFSLLSWIIGNRLNASFKAYSKIPTENNFTGKEVAEKMLRDNDITDVSVRCVEGQLTDHYNPVTKVVNLSKAVYYGNSVASAAVAAHECGHAVQHAEGYAWLQLRSSLVPVVNFASKWVMWVLLAGIVLFALTTLFSFVTLPVEINASKRALAWIDAHRITSDSTHPKAQHALRLAAYTYVVAALSSLATLFYYVMIYLGGRDD